MKKLLIIIAVLLLTGCNKDYSKNIFYMDTIINIKIYNTNKSKAETAFEKIENLYKKYEYIASYYNEDSELYKLNNSIEEKVYLSDELLSLIKFGEEWYSLSNGLLNINIGNLTKIWHDFRNNNQLPDNELLNEININNNIKFEGNYIINNNIDIDLGAIAKGYVTELASKYLEDNNINYYIINAGGNVKVGKSYKGYYNIGIQSPINNENFDVIKASNISVVTSGGYERYYEIDGNLYHHIIDPKTKYPSNYVKSVTVIGKNSAICDALSTTLFLMDVESGKEFIKNFDVAVIWFTNSNEIIKSDGFNYE